MVRPITQQAYTVANATGSILAPVQEARDPTTGDVNYPLYQAWINTSNLNTWELLSFTSISGTVLASWVQMSGTTLDVHTITGDSGSVVHPVANNVNIVGQGTPNTSGIATSGSGATLAVTMQSPFSGNFTFTNSTSGATEALTVSNTSDTASSQAQIVASVAGTSSGDAWNQWNVGSTRSYAMGIDTSSTRDFKMTYANSASITPSTGTEVFFYDPDAADDIQWAFRVHNFENSFPYVGGRVGVGAINEDSTNLSSAANLAAGTTGAGSGDPYVQLAITITPTSTVNKFGLDNSDSDSFKYNVGCSAGVPNIDGNTVFQITQSGNVSIPVGNLEVKRSDASTVPTINCQNTNAVNSALISCVANSPGVGFFSAGVADDVQYWNFGAVPSNAVTNARGFNLSYNTVGQSDPSQGTPMVLVSTTGNVTLQKDNTNTISLNNVTAATIGANGAATALTANPVGYIAININGVAYQIPYYNHA